MSKAGQNLKTGLHHLVVALPRTAVALFSPTKADQWFLTKEELHFRLMEEEGYREEPKLHYKIKEKMDSKTKMEIIEKHFAKLENKDP